MTGFLNSFRRQLLPTAVTLGAITLVVLIKSVLFGFFAVEAPLTLFYTAIIASAWYGGRRQGFLAVALTLLASYIFFIYPTSLWTGEHTFGTRMLLFSIDGIVVTLICSSLRESRERAEVTLRAYQSAQTLSQESQIRFNRVFESNMIGLSIVQMEGPFIDCNDYVLNLLDYTREDLQAGRLNWRDLTPIEQLPKADETASLLKFQESVIPYEKEYFRRDGTRVPVIVCVARLDDDTAVVFIIDNRINKRNEQVLEERVNERTRELRSIAEKLQQSEQFLDSVVENLPNMVFVKDAEDLRFVRFNRAGEELLGTSRADLIGKNVYDIFPKAEAQLFEAQDRAVLEGQVIDIPEQPLPTKSGLRYLHTKKIPILDQEGKSIYLLGISEDITDRKASELQQVHLLQEQARRAEAEKAAEQLRFLSEAGAALNESLDLKSRLDAFAQIVITHLGDWCEIVLVDSVGATVQEAVVAHRNPKMREWAGEYRRKNSIDWEQKSGIAQVIRSGKPELHPVITAAMLEQSMKDSVRREGMLNTGIHSAMIVPLQSYGRIIGALTICSAEDQRSFNTFDLSLAQDLAKRAAFAIENSRLYRQAQEASQAKSAFLANMSHEIRTPLGAMLGFAELLADEQLTARQHEYLGTLSRNGKQLLEIVDEVLDLAKIESDRIQIESVEFSLPQLIHEIVALLQPLAQAKRLMLAVNLPSDIPVKITSDPTRLRQILINVIGNAVKFTLEGRVDVGVKVHERPTHPRRPVLEIIVQDTGIGISREQREQLFQAFVQADNSTTRRFGGTGLGLFLSRRLARLMGGDVILGESVLDRGSRFVITTTVAVNEEHQQPAPAPASAPSLAVEESKSKVLVVDDAPDNRMLIELLLTRLGYEAETAATGQEAVNLALKNNYSVILMDVQMPEMDGFEAVNRLRAQNYSGPIVALTAHTMKGDRERCLSGGFDDYLGKPIDRELLKVCLEKHARTETQRTPSTGASSDSLTHR